MIRRLIDLIKSFKLAYCLGLKKTSLKQRINFLCFFLKNKILRKNIPFTVILGVTERCQCLCSHCSVKQNNNSEEGSEMNTAEMKKCIDQIADLGSVKINFFGGEPLIRNDIVELTKYASAKGLIVFIDTNGLLLDRSMVKSLKKAGVSCLLVSIDSADLMIHDASRKVKGCFEKAIEGLRICIQNDIPCVISTIVTNDMASGNNLKKVIMLGKDVGVSGIRLLLPMLSGNWKDKKEQLLQPAGWDNMIENLEPGYIYLESDFCLFAARKRKLDCMARKKLLIYISSYGNIGLCYVLPGFLGNIKKDKLSDVIRDFWQNANGILSGHGCLSNDDLAVKSFRGFTKGS